MVLGTLYFAACLGLMLWSGAAELGSLDFTSFYAAGRLALSGPASVYDLATHHAMQKAVTGNPSVAYSYFFYPPVLLLLCAPLATLPYPLAYAAWAALQLGFYALALRKVVGRGATIGPLPRLSRRPARPSDGAERHVHRRAVRRRHRRAGGAA
jgi:alpha-1,2-mannosyltransferase